MYLIMPYVLSGVYAKLACQPAGSADVDFAGLCGKQCQRVYNMHSVQYEYKK